MLAPLTPRLSPYAEVTLQHFRGRPWYVVSDRASGAAFRLSAAMAVVLEQDAAVGGTLAERLAHSTADPPPAEREALARATLRLYAGGLLEFEPASAVPAAVRALRTDPLQRRRLNPLALRLPLGDPDRWLTRLAPFARVLFSRATGLAFALLVAVLALLGAMHGPALTADLLSQLDSPVNWWLYALAYVGLKTFHELAHAFAVKRWGGHVHEVGVMLLVFFPVPYVDASASTAFSDKYARITVAGAGIAAELTAAALALLVWLHTAPGLVHTLAFDVVVIGSLSTLLFNGNPLMRFDAYYAFSDLVEIPNLYTRARSHLADLVLARVLGVRGAGTAAASAGEARWLTGYGAASVIYRSGVLLAIALYLATQFFIIGTAFALWLLATEFVVPLWRFLARAHRLDRRARRRLGAGTRLAAGLLAGLAAAAWVPLPQATVAPGVVATADDTRLRAGTEGFVRAVYRAPGDRVAAGDPVLALEDDNLRLELAAAQARVRELTAEHTAAAGVDRAAARVIEDSLAASRRHAAAIAERVERLTVRAPAAGILVSGDLADLQDAWVARGETLAYVADPGRVIVRAVVPESRLDLLDEPPRAISLRLADSPQVAVAARAVGGVPASLERLPSAALGTAGGGPIAVDPGAGDRVTPLVRVFELAVAPLAPLPAARVDGRAWVRFEHAAEPLLPRALRALQRLVLAKFPG